MLFCSPSSLLLLLSWRDSCRDEHVFHLYKDRNLGWDYYSHSIRTVMQNEEFYVSNMHMSLCTAQIFSSHTVQDHKLFLPPKYCYVCDIPGSSFILFHFVSKIVFLCFEGVGSYRKFQGDHLELVKTEAVCLTNKLCCIDNGINPSSSYGWCEMDFYIQFIIQ